MSGGWPATTEKIEADMRESGLTRWKLVKRTDLVESDVGYVGMDYEGIRRLQQRKTVPGPQDFRVLMSAVGAPLIPALFEMGYLPDLPSPWTSADPVTVIKQLCRCLGVQVIDVAEGRVLVDPHRR